MATFYPNSSAQLDAVSTPYIQDQKFTSNYDSPMIHGNLMMYLNEASSAGSFSEIGPATSMSNCVEIPSMVLGRNEMMHPVEGEQNFQGLSLSLSTQLSTAVQPPSFQHFSNHLPHKVDEAFEYKDLTNPAYGQYDFHGDGQSFIRFGAQNNLQYMVNPKGVGYNGYQYEQASSASSIMKSKYLKATQQLLDEIVNVQDALKQHESAKQQNVSKFEDKQIESNEKSAADSDVNELSSSAPSKELSATERQELQNKLDKLLTMLDEADRRYKQYYHQMQVLVSSFDLVAGSGGAKPYTTLARKTISRHFRSLRDAIGVQIQNTRRSLGEQDSGQGVIPRLRHVDLQLRQQRALQQFGMMRHAWRPQRGLPENAVTTLRAWLFEHFLHPYPKDSEKIMLARQTGLTRGQVANWFINARVRLWKPMIEEIYKEEFGDADLNLKSSSENNTPKAAGEKSWASEDRSIADAMPSHDDYKTSVYHHTTEMSQSTGRDGVMVGPHGGDDKHRGLMKLSEDHHQGLTNHGFYPHDQNSLMSFQVQELGNYGVDNQVTLALGLRRVDGDVGHVSDETGLRPGSSAGDDAIEPGTTTTEYSYFGGVNQQHRFSNSHLLNDFVV